LRHDWLLDQIGECDTKMIRNVQFILIAPRTRVLSLAQHGAVRGGFMLAEWPGRAGRPYPRLPLPPWCLVDAEISMVGGEGKAGIAGWREGDVAKVAPPTSLFIEVASGTACGRGWNLPS